MLRTPLAIEPAAGGHSVAEQALKAQAELLPYALLTFGISLPVYVWAGSFAANSAWMSGALAVFALAWGAFYWIVNWLKTPAAGDLRRRARVQVLGGLLWAAAVLQMAAFAEGAGAARETLLMMALAAGGVCAVFTAPWLPSLLLVAPLAMAGPLVALFSHPQSHGLARLSWGAVALALALALVANRMLRRQFGLAAEREVLIAERAEQAQAARRLARSKSDLVAALGDEIRNGLTGVAHVLAAAAGRGGRAAPSRVQLAAAVQAADDLLAVLDTTLDAETAEAGRLSVDIVAFDAVALARDVVLLHRPAAAARQLEIALQVAPELTERETGAAVGDPARVRQVLAALVGNAVKYTVRGRVEARLSLTGAGRLAIEVADTGPGLTDDELAQAFEPFQRIARTCAGVPGAGLGLTLARQLARLMGGELKAHGAPGVGACFTLELPWDASVPLAPPAEGEARPPRAPERRRLRVLLVEDRSLDAAMLRAHLEQLGHQVVHATSARRAVDLARVCDLDLAVAGVDGAGLVKGLRRLDGHAARIPVVALIGGDPEEARACVAAGAEAVLRKPATATVLARAVAEALAAPPPANDRDVA